MKICLLILVVLVLILHGVKCGIDIYKSLTTKVSLFENDEWIVEIKE